MLECTAKSLQSRPTLCDPIDGSLPGSSIPGILQERTLELVAISFSNAWKWKVKVESLSPPHGLQPTRLLCPWNFPGKSTGVECHCLLHVGVINNVAIVSVAQQSGSAIHIHTYVSILPHSLPIQSLHNIEQSSLLWAHFVTSFVVSSKAILLKVLPLGLAS